MGCRCCPIGAQHAVTINRHCGSILRASDRAAGHGEQIVLSTDTSVWINPPEMAYERSIEHLLGTFLPAVEARLGAEARTRLARQNVVRAIGRPASEQTPIPEEG